MRAYLRPGRALRPIEIAAALNEVATVRALPWHAHPVEARDAQGRGDRPVSGALDTRLRSSGGKRPTRTSASA